jgi:hypothetical protein
MRTKEEHLYWIDLEIADPDALIDGVDRAVNLGVLVPVKIDYEALATRIQDDDDMAGHIIARHSEYVKLARSYAETLGIGGDDERTNDSSG